MTRDDILALLVRRNAAFKARDSATLASLHAQNGVVASPAGGVQEGHEDIHRVYRVWFAVFPDIIFHEDGQLVDENRAVQILRFSGTHAGEFFGLPATGRHVEVTMVCVLTFRDGLISEERRIYDFTGMLVQLGVLKAKPHV